MNSRFYLGPEAAAQSALRIEYRARYFSRLPPEDFSADDFPTMLAELPYREPYQDRVKRARRPQSSWLIGVSRPITDPIRDIHAQLCAEIHRRR